MSACKDCRHWDVEEWDNPRGRLCARISPDSCAEGQPWIDADHALQGAFLITPPDFGCTLFEPKEGDPS